MEIWGGGKKIKQVAEKVTEFRFFTRIHTEEKFIFKTFYTCIANHVGYHVEYFLSKNKKQRVKHVINHWRSFYGRKESG